MTLESVPAFHTVSNNTFIEKGFQCLLDAKEKRYDEKFRGIVLPHMTCLPLLKFFIFSFVYFPQGLFDRIHFHLEVMLYQVFNSCEK